MGCTVTLRNIATIPYRHRYSLIFYMSCFKKVYVSSKGIGYNNNLKRLKRQGLWGTRVAL